MYVCLYQRVKTTLVYLSDKKYLIKLHVMEDDMVGYSAACMHVSIWRWERGFIKLVVFAEYLTRWDLFGLDALFTRMFQD